MFVNAGFILGFDSEKGAVADAIVELIQDAAIPLSIVGCSSRCLARSSPGASKRKAGCMLTTMSSGPAINVLKA
jgi:hypothetical protein